MSSPNKRSTSNSSDESDQENGREVPPTSSRRDDNSISFRHFLQQQSDVVPTANPRRPPRGSKGNGALMDLVDVHGGLPDFVQDHLVLSIPNKIIVEAQAGREGNHSLDGQPVPNPVSPLDLAVINEVMPNLMNSSSQRHSNSTISGGGDGVDVEQLGAYGPIPSGGGPSLPDFLSDGPMHCDATGSNDVVSDVQGMSNRFVPLRCSTGSLGRSQLRSSSSQNVDSLLQQIKRLENELQQRDRTIQTLENLIFEQKAELVGLYEQIAENQNTESNNCNHQHSTSSSSCHQNTAAAYSGHENAAAASSATVTNGSISNPTPSPSTNNSRRIQECATRAESLLCELLKEIRQLKNEDDSN